jgi:hypothetical protein
LYNDKAPLPINGKQPNICTVHIPNQQQRPQQQKVPPQKPLPRPEPPHQHGHTQSTPPPPPPKPPPKPHHPPQRPPETTFVNRILESLHLGDLDSGDLLLLGLLFFLWHQKADEELLIALGLLLIL